MNAESDPDLIILPYTFAPTQQVELSGGNSSTTLRVFVSVQMVSSLTVRIVKTNTVTQSPETTEQLIGRLIAAAGRRDLASLASIFITAFQCPDLNMIQAEQAILTLSTCIRSLFADPSPEVAVVSIRLLHLGLGWMVNQQGLLGSAGILTSSCGLLLWLASPDGLGAAPLTDKEFWSAAVVADYLDALAANIANTVVEEGVAVTRSAANKLRLIAMEAYLRGWTIGQAPVELYGATGFVRAVAELKKSTLMFTSDVIMGTRPDAVLTLPAILPESIAGADDLASISAWITKTGLPQDKNPEMDIISRISVIQLSPYSGHGRSMQSGVPREALSIVGTLVELKYNASSLPIQDRARIAGGHGIACVIWHADPSNPSQESWDESSCSVESVRIDDSNNKFKSSAENLYGTGYILCSCDSLGTIAVAYFRGSFMGATNFYAQWSEDTPRDGDELVVTAGSQLLLKISAVSQSRIPWRSLSSNASPCSLSFSVAGNVSITLMSSLQPNSWPASGSDATLSFPATSENFDGVFYSQYTTWNLSISPELTLALRKSATLTPEIYISSILNEDASGGRLRRWTLRILDCEALVSSSDTLTAIAARYGTSPRLLFALNPVLSKPDMLPAPEGGLFDNDRWDCGGEYPVCTLNQAAVGGAGGIRLRIGRLALIGPNASVADEVARLGGSLRHVAEQNQGRITVLSLTPLILGMDQAHEVCIVMHDLDTC